MTANDRIQSKIAEYSPAARTFFQFSGRTTYKEGYWFEYDLDNDGKFSIRVKCHRLDAITGEMGIGEGPKVVLWDSITESQLARTMMGLILGYEEHEAREFFKVDGVAVFGPHIHINALLEAGKRLDHLE